MRGRGRRRGGVNGFHVGKMGGQSQTAIADKAVVNSISEFAAKESLRGPEEESRRFVTTIGLWKDMFYRKF